MVTQRASKVGLITFYANAEVHKETRKCGKLNEHAALLEWGMENNTARKETQKMKKEEEDEQVQKDRRSNGNESHHIEDNA